MAHPRVRWYSRCLLQKETHHGLRVHVGVSDCHLRNCCGGGGFPPRHQGEAVGSAAGKAGCSVRRSSGRLTPYATPRATPGCASEGSRAPCRPRKVIGYVRATIARHDAEGRQRSHSKPLVTAYELPPPEKLVMAHPRRRPVPPRISARWQPRAPQRRFVLRVRRSHSEAGRWPAPCSLKTAGAFPGPWRHAVSVQGGDETGARTVRLVKSGLGSNVAASLYRRYAGVP
jgi:hypothetical protein